MADYTICDDWGEGSGLELHEKNCNEDQIGNKKQINLSNISRRKSLTHGHLKYIVNTRLFSILTWLFSLSFHSQSILKCSYKNI